MSFDLKKINLKLKIKHHVKFMAFVFLMLCSTLSQIAFAGPGKGGGDTGVSKDMTAIPIDYHFVEVLTEFNPQVDTPEAFEEYRGFIAKIQKAIPSLAADLEKNFKPLTWKKSFQNMNFEGCMNNLGFYKLDVEGSQQVIACQHHDSVILNLIFMASLKSEKMLGGVFLHEAFVHMMLNDLMEQVIPEQWNEVYAERENWLITEVMPYIIKTETLDAKRLFKMLFPLGIMTNSDRFAENGIHRYLIDSDTQAKEDYLIFKQIEADALTLRSSAEQSRLTFLEMVNAFRKCENENVNLSNLLKFNDYKRKALSLANKIKPMFLKSKDAFLSRSKLYPNDEALRRSFIKAAYEMHVQFMSSEISDLVTNLNQVLVPYCQKKLFSTLK